MPSHYEPHVQVVNVPSHIGVDVVGDLHGCVDELIDLLHLAGYVIDREEDGRGFAISHPKGRRLFLVGDLTDRGPKGLDALRFVRSLIKSGVGTSVIGNHDDKLLRAMIGRKVKVANGLEGTLTEIRNAEPAELEDLRAMLASLPTQIHILKSGRRDAIIVHAAAPQHHQMLGRSNSYERAIYGYPDGPDDNGHLLRADWSQTYAGDRIIVHGHVPTPQPYENHRVFTIDTAASLAAS